jgi:hypothetical protein
LTGFDLFRFFHTDVFVKVIPGPECLISEQNLVDSSFKISQGRSNV